MTGAELKLWNVVRAHRLIGLGFRRQMPIAGYIVDFACPEHKIVVELDGSQHGKDDEIAYDTERTKFLESRGYKVLRFWNSDVTANLDSLVEFIFAEAKARQPKHPHPER